jgi:hypothetical protein
MDESLTSNTGSSIPTRSEIEALTETQRKIFENRLRRAAERQGLRLEKFRARDTKHLLYGTYRLVDERKDTVVMVDWHSGRGHGLDLHDVARYLFRQTNTPPSTYVIRGDVVWPSRLVQPARPPALVYLDMNHFINLAKVAVGTAPDGYAELLEACRKARADGRAIFPLSATHCQEIADIRSFQQRSNIAAVMEELSDFKYLFGRPIIMRLEVEAAVDAVIGMTPLPSEGLPLSGHSILWAFGMRGGLTVQGDEGEAAAQRLRDRLGDQIFDRMMAHFNREAERLLLTGPDKDDEAELRQHGYAPERPHIGQEKRAQQERQQAQILDANPEWRRGRLRDVIGAREMLIELNETLANAIATRNITLTDLMGLDVNEAREFSDGMPSTRVAVTLKTHYHRDGRHEWTSNDIHDIDALAVAVPYCDAVFTDKAARNALVSNKQLDIFETFLPRRPDDLAQWLQNLPI